MNKQTVQREKSGSKAAHRQRAPEPDAPDRDLLEQPPSQVGVQEALARPAMTSPANMVALQRTVGNRVVQRLVQPTVVQRTPEEELRKALARRRALINPEDTETISELNVGALLEQKKRERQEELETLHGRGLVTGKSEKELGTLSGMLSTRLPTDERGLRERGYDPMEQTLYGKPKYLASTVGGTETPVETETPKTTGEGSSGVLSELLSLIEQLTEKLGLGD